MAYRDLRTFLEDLREAGELAHVEVEVDPNQEIGAICRMVCREGGPALFFERVNGTDIFFAANVFGSRGRALPGGVDRRRRPAPRSHPLGRLERERRRSVYHPRRLRWA